MDKFKEKELTKKRTFAKNTWFDWYDWLVNCIPEPMKKQWVVLKTKLQVLKKKKNRPSQGL